MPQAYEEGGRIIEEHDQAAAETHLEGSGGAEKVVVRNGFAGAIVGSSEAQVANGGALVIAAGNTMQVNGGGAGALLAGNSLHINGGGGWVLVAGNSIPIQNGGGAVLIASQAEVTRGAVGVLRPGHTTLGEGARVLLNTPQALALGAACGMVFALVGRGLRGRAR
jgi:hypothetical protein